MSGEEAEDGGAEQPAEAAPTEAERQLSFEEALEQLEQIIEEVESAEHGLEQSLAAYEKGTRLIARCRRILEHAERRIGELEQDAEGGLHVKGEAPASSDTDADGGEGEA
jgi:exodeoxyribonuclease VII small subunit